MKTNHKPIHRLLALCLALLLVLSACKPNNTGSTRREGNGTFYKGGQSIPRNLTNFGDIEYTRPDVEELKRMVAEATTNVAAATSFEGMLEASESGDDLWVEFNTMYTYVNLQTYLHVNDAFYDEEMRFLQEHAVELTTLSNELTRAMLEGPFAAEYREYLGDYLFEYLENSLLLNSPEVEAYKQERQGLELDYKNLLADLSLIWEGKEYTLDEILEVDAGFEQMLYMYIAYFSQNAPAFAELYARLIELDKLTAEILGFDSAAEMYYLTYSRDYTPADALELAHNLRDTFSGMVSPVLAQTGSIYMEYDEVMEAVPTLLKTIDKDFLVAWNDMLQYNLYDFEPKDDKMSGIGFTTYLSAYDAPFIYVYWDDSFSSASTIIHEFGHFYDSWLHYDSSVVQNLDIAEVYSQGLELLAYHHLDLLTSHDRAARTNSLGDFVQVVTYQSMLEELQLRAYELDEVTAETIGALYTELQVDYGYGDYVFVDENGLDNSWFQVTHLFEAPFYTISYSTSALAALQIWAAGSDKPQDAVDVYFDLLYADQNQPFTALLESAGLKSVFDMDTINEIAGLLRENLMLSSRRQQAA